MLGYAYAMTGRLADALPILEQAVEHARVNRTFEAGLGTYLTEAWLLARLIHDGVGGELMDGDEPVGLA